MARGKNSALAVMHGRPIKEVWIEYKAAATEFVRNQLMEIGRASCRERV